MPVPLPRTNGKPQQNHTPKLVNRGAGGLLIKLTEEDRKRAVPADNGSVPKVTKVVAKYRIAPELRHMAVGIDSVTPDPINARLHPERNMEAITLSLSTYGQVKPIVVRRETSVIVAGNGTHAAAKALGWDEIAVHFVEMNEVEAVGFGLADNRTAELADWDYKNVKVLDRILVDAGHPTCGWSDDELVVLRSVAWTPAAVTDEQFQKDGTVTIKMTAEEMETVGIAVSVVREKMGSKKLTEGRCLKIVCGEWLIPPTVEGDRFADPEYRKSLLGDE